MKQIQKRIVLIIECFPGNSSYQGSCSHSGPKSIPASPGILSMTLGSSLDLLWALWGQFRHWSGPIPACICSLSLLLWRLDWFQLWEYSHLFRYSSYTGFTKLISGILWNCTERFPLLFLSHTAHVAKHGFSLYFYMSAALRHLFPVQVRGRESSSCLGHNYSLRQDCNHLWWLALVEVPPSAHGGRSWHVGMVPALLSLCAPLQWCISFQKISLPLGDS